MKAKDLKDIFHKELDQVYGKDEVASFFHLGLEHHLNVARIKLQLEPEFTLSKSETDVFFELLEGLKQQKPIQYLLGEIEFYGLQFKVNENVLIPRPETEELVDWIINDAKSKIQNSETIKILDIGTGSGCIAISLAKHLPEAQVFAVDISESALEIAKENADRNGVEVKFIKTNILEFSLWEDVALRQKGFFDIIVSNPPYVRELEKQEIKPNVLDNEPHLALFVENENPLLFYKAITDFAVDKLKSNGSLYFEINQYLGQETKQLLVDAEFKAVELRKDLNGNDRMLKGIKQ
ncbi:protein-(glutamine-N5) methyltransferase, release factor-specific [Winogradskyella sp. J14-2]|uniref:peptide chain release factor N(5)-glutamine methyltransferase n=1 Tax=Winogradskyella sp. J14-2 TaxID=1936080 RepID=UPI0009727FAE|nr:peptide chain release factor N(5)-glutamine methyltransferase [Winogradskyella sp. J14-2]APY07454.1 protein-(glutamine-N5) methyltransferase, release factor-specific [Winogradskyella sp. J14-2]